MAKRVSWVVAGAGLALAGVLAAGAYLMLDEADDGTVEPTPAATRSAAPALASVLTPEPTDSADIVSVMRAVFPGADRDGFIVGADPAAKDVLEGAVTSPSLLAGTPGRPILVTQTTAKDACHSCFGFLSVYYLRREGQGYAVVSRHPNFLGGNGFGGVGQLTPARLRDGTEVFAYDTGWTGQGVTCGSIAVVQLQDDGPRMLLNNEPFLYADSSDDVGKLIQGEVVREPQNRDFELAFREDGRPQGVVGYSLEGAQLVPVTGRNPVREMC